jgi:hypothetical protein
VVLHTAEVVTTRNVRQVGDRQHAGGHDEEAGPVLGAVVGRHRPRGGPLVPHRRAHPGVEAHVAPQVEAVDDVVQVALDLRLAGEVLLPLPVVEQLAGEEVAVGVALGVEPGARVAVPEPRAAHAAAGLEQLRREPRLEGAVELVDAGDAGADDQHVEGLGPVGGRRERHCTDRLA